jgi:hypothetical protein
MQPSGKSFKSLTRDSASLNHLADVRSVCIVLPGVLINSNRRVRLLESDTGDALASRFKSDKNNVACGDKIKHRRGRLGDLGPAHRQQHFGFETNTDVERSNADAKRYAEVKNFIWTGTLEHDCGNLEGE